MGIASALIKLVSLLGMASSSSWEHKEKGMVCGMCSTGVGG